MATKKRPRGAAKKKPAAHKAALGASGEPAKRAVKAAAPKKSPGRAVVSGETAKKPARKKATTVAAAAAPRPSEPVPFPSPSRISITVNGVRRDLELGRDLAPETTLASLLRERLGHTGLKVACDEGACGACTVLLDGKAVLSCMMLAVEADGREVLTIEGLAKDDPVVEAFAEQSEPGYGTALQCGFCTPGFVMTAKGLLRENPTPTLAEIKEGLSGNLCRCGCYAGIARAVEKAAARGEGGCR